MLMPLLLAMSVIAVHPEGNPNARLLTVEEAVKQSAHSVYPEEVKLWWDADGRLIPTERGWLLGNELYGALWDLAPGEVAAARC